MTATIHRFKRPPHVFVTALAPAAGRLSYEVELVDSEGRHRDVWSGPDFAEAIAEAAYLDCPILLRLDAIPEARP